MHRVRSRLMPAVAVGAVLAAVYLVLDPPSVDLPAHVYRTALADKNGWLIWDNGWYGGHSLPSYSVLFPQLAALLGPKLVAALAVLAGTWAAATLADAVPAALFGLALAANAAAGRLVFVAGIAVGAWGVALAHRGRTPGAAILGLLATATSPVAGVFTGLVATAGALRLRPRAPWLALAGGALVAGVVLGVLFGQAGTQPFAASDLWPALAVTAAAFVLAPAPVWRTGAVLYLALLVLAAIVPNALGSNAVRLAGLLVGPLVFVALWPQHRRLLAVLAVPALYLVLYAPIRDAIVLHDDPSASAAYFTPLLDELHRRSAGAAPARVEIPFTRAHWEAARVAGAFPIARGWERQLDRDHNPLFYDGPLNARTYRAWLADNAVRWVALPDVALDSAGRAEGALVRAGLPYLRRVWRSPHWQLFEVDGAAPLGAKSLGPDWFTTAGGVVRVRWTPYWAVTEGHGCVSEAPGGWTLVEPRPAGSTVRVAIHFDLGRAFSRGRRCS